MKRITGIIMICTMLLMCACGGKENSIEGTRGTIVDNTYTNDTFHMTFQIPEGATVLTDDQIAKVLGISSSVFTDSGLATADQMETTMSGCIYDTMFLLSDGKTSVSVIYDNMDISSSGKLMTENEYAEDVKKQLAQVTTTTYEIGEPYEITIGGQQYVRVDATTSVGLTQVYCYRKQDNYMVCIAMNYTKEGNAAGEDFLHSISVYDGK